MAPSDHLFEALSPAPDWTQTFWTACNDSAASQNRSSPQKTLGNPGQTMMSSRIGLPLNCLNQNAWCFSQSKQQVDGIITSKLATQHKGCCRFNRFNFRWKKHKCASAGIQLWLRQWPEESEMSCIFNSFDWKLISFSGQTMTSLTSYPPQARSQEKRTVHLFRISSNISCFTIHRPWGERVPQIRCRKLKRNTTPPAGTTGRRSVNVLPWPLVASIHAIWIQRRNENGPVHMHFAAWIDRSL